jgi:hypothetical protein
MAHPPVDPQDEDDFGENSTSPGELFAYVCIALGIAAFLVWAFIAP